MAREKTKTLHHHTLRQAYIEKPEALRRPSGSHRSRLMICFASFGNAVHRLAQAPGEGVDPL
jgi:hypothetical protein